MARNTLLARYMTWVDSGKPSAHFTDKTSYLAVQGSGPSRHTYVWFANPFPKTGANVSRAVLRFTTRAAPAAARTITVAVPTKGLHFRGMTWNNRVNEVVYGVSATSTRTDALTNNGVWEVDVTDIMQRVADGLPFPGLRITANTASPIYFNGRMADRLKPTLVVEHTQAPKAPDSLSPSAGRAAGRPAPTLRWSFYDHAGASNLLSVQVQTSAYADFRTVAWDSGTVDTSWCTLDLAETSFPPLTVGQVVYWRVRNRDTDGLWSAWSTPTSFTYQPLPTVAVMAPSGGTTPDPTPLLDWTYKGATPQARFQVLLQRRIGSQWRTERTMDGVGADTDYNPTINPSAWVRGMWGARDGVEYRYVLRVWDSMARESTPGSPSYAEAVAHFRFDPDAALVPPTNLVALDNGAAPTVTLLWERAETPDEWVIQRDGEHLARYPGPDLLVSAGKFRIPDALCPNGVHTWEVRAVTNGHATVSAKVTQEHTHEGTWLCNEDTNELVCFMNDTAHDMKAPEVSTVHEVLGASRVTIITEALRGYEGSVDGGIYTLKGYSHSARQQADLFRKFKGDVGQVYRLLIEDKSFPVVVRNLNISADPDHGGIVGESYLASFDWYQVGEVDWATDMAGDA